MRVKAIPRFLDKISFGHGPGACWTWMGGDSGNGYGRFSWRGKERAAHRLAYRAARGRIPDGLEIDHLCRNRACVNPEHMEAVTRKVNALRGISFSAVNAKKVHCPRGHPLSRENTYRDPQGGRECRVCRQRRARESWGRRKAGGRQ